MANASDIAGKVFKHGTITTLARVLGAANAPVVQTDIASISYTIYLLDSRDPDNWTPVTGHSSVALTVSAVVFNTLQTDAAWTTDAIGYNFRHEIDISVNQAFNAAGSKYLVEYRFVPNTGQAILVRSRLTVI
jgi:hypothetical protein